MVTGIRYHEMQDPSKGKRTPRYRVEWQIDPQMDHAILKWSTRTFDKDGRPKGPPVVCETEYRVMDGYWLAARSRSENNYYRVEEVVVHEMNVNRREHPAALSPKVMNLAVGIVLHYPQKWGQLPDLGALRVWDGEGLREFQEWQLVQGGYDLSALEQLRNKSLVPDQA